MTIFSVIQILILTFILGVGSYKIGYESGRSAGFESGWNGALGKLEEQEFKQVVEMDTGVMMKACCSKVERE